MTVRRGLRLLARGAGFGLLLLANGCLFTDPILGEPGPNKPPELTVQPTASTDPPLVLSADAKVTFIAQAHDPDGVDAALLYQWQLDGEVVSQAQGATTYNLDASAHPAGAHALQVTVTDPLGASVSANWALQIQ